jgi:putative ABC transport system substrate-binding protein
VPTIYGDRLFSDAGGLMSFSVDLVDLCRRAAGHVDKILCGARAGDLPVEEAVKFEVVINMKAAKGIGLTIPPSLLQRAEQVSQ